MKTILVCPYNDVDSVVILDDGQCVTIDAFSIVCGEILEEHNISEYSLLKLLLVKS